jgi:hypothetical protein
MLIHSASLHGALTHKKKRGKLFMTQAYENKPYMHT